jgi:hypothetical protein
MTHPHPPTCHPLSPLQKEEEVYAEKPGKDVEL